MAQGIGNVVAGLIGGLPVTSVIVRSSVNINAGAKTQHVGHRSRRVAVGHRDVPADVART